MRPVRDSTLNSDKLAELLVGPREALVRVTPYYGGYGGDTDAMRQDWEAWGDHITAFWLSGKVTGTDTLADYGISVRVPRYNRIWCMDGN